MASVVEALDLIGKTVEELLDFVAQDEVVSKDFEEYLNICNIEINSEKEFNNVIMQYIFDMKMQNGLRVLEYYRRNNKIQDEVVNSLENSFTSVFQVNKILSNAFEVVCLTSNVSITIIPMVKLHHLKQIGKNDYIVARIIELDGVQYILEIYDVISEFNVYKATTTAIQYLIQNPKTAHYKNPIKLEELEKSVGDFWSKFNEFFGCNYIVTTNKKIDKLIEVFNQYRLDGIKTEYSELIENLEKNRFLNIEEFESDSGTFLENAICGFSSHKELYDVGLWMDKKRGLYIIPFLDTFFKCFEGCFADNVVMLEKCLKDFLTNDKVPPSVLKFASEKYENFFDVINSTLKIKFSTLEEILFNTKTSYATDGLYSPVTVLFNSELFSSILSFDEEKKENE